MRAMLENNTAKQRPPGVGLLPCPFCGPGQSQVDLWFDDSARRYRVGCGRCGCSTGISPRDKTEVPAITAWNTRATAETGRDEHRVWAAAVMIAGMVETTGCAASVAEALQDENQRRTALEMLKEDQADG